MVACAPGGSGSIGSSDVGTGSSTPGITGTANTLTGVVHGGQSPIVGATVSLYEAGPAGTPPSAPLLTTTTDSNGNYSFSNVADSCTSPSSSALLYVVASGGNPGAGVNSAINLMAALGPCSDLPSYAVINELTTVAAVYALNGFAYKNTAPPSSPGTLNGCVDCTPSSPSDMTELNGNAPGITNAFNTAALLADVATGDPATWLPTASQCSGASPPVNCGAVEKLATLATSLAACVNSASSSSAQCNLLFCVATPGTNAAYSPVEEGYVCALDGATIAVSDTLAATLSIARNPGLVSVNGIYDVSTQYTQFTPVLSAAPNDWTISLNFTGGGLDGPFGIAIDGSGDVWVANVVGNSVTELNSSGAALSGSGGFTGGGLNEPAGVAIDGSGDVWVTNYNGGSVTELNSSGTALSGSGGFTGGGLNEPGVGIAVDGSGDVWVANDSGNSVTELNSSGTVLSGSGGFTGGGLSGPNGLAIDGSGDVWVANSNNNSVTELNSSGTVLSGSGGFTGGGLSVPYGLAIDGSGDVWVANHGSNSVTELNSSGTVLSGSSGFTGGGLDGPYGIAIDGGGDVWVANSNNNSVTELNSSGTALSGSSGFTGGGLNEPGVGIAVDGSGDVWVANLNSNSVTELIGAAVPTVTPLVAQQR